MGIYEQGALCLVGYMASNDTNRSFWTSFAELFGVDEDEAKPLALAPFVIALFVVLFFRINGCEDSKNAVALALAAEGEAAAKNASLDTDGDGVPDINDHCLSVAANTPSGCPSDTDGDGVIDTQDKCPEVFGSGKDGCNPPKPVQVSDRDGDGVSDRNDRCPDIVGTGKDGCRLDRDGDGVFDPNDQCPNVAGDDRGCPRDTDADGVPDAADDCPNRKGTIEKAGCPEVVISASERGALELAVKNVEFKTASATLTKSSLALVDKVADILLNHPELQLSIEGHTDNVGDAGRNQALSKRRADSCLKRMVSRGIAPERIRSAGLGQTRPIVPNDTEVNRRKNRRVEFTLR